MKLSLASKFLCLVTSLFLANSYTDVPCQWKSKAGLSFDLQPLMVLKEKDYSYQIEDGDIPCTPEIEPSYSYVWNFCHDVTEASFPDVCSPMQMGAALQYIDRDDGYQECNVIGHYDPLRDDTYFKLLDIEDPSKGISMTYLFGHRCPDGNLRSATINIYCDGVDMVIDSADEPTTCNYHLNTRSQHGCPLECPITSNGLCNAHGHCAFDKNTGKPHCYCNEGYTGNSCEPISTSSNTGSISGHSVQVGFLIALVIMVVVLLATVGYLAYRIVEFRKDQNNSYSALFNDASSHGRGTEMTNRINNSQNNNSAGVIRL